MPVSNSDRFPDVDFLPPDQFKVIGDVEGTPLVLIGREQGTEAPVVARSRTDDPTTESLFAVPLYELMSHTFGEINIEEEI